uniref:Uncharacterized protein n=1 Tax=Plectus sambesii TaxID=2011161 RepID=A0A914WTL9_9BILA
MAQRLPLVFLLLTVVVVNAIPLRLRDVQQPQKNDDIVDNIADYYNDEEFTPLYLNTDIELLKRDLEYPYDLDLPEELLNDEELPRTFRKTIALLQAFNDLEKRDVEKEMVVDVPPSLAYRFEIPRTDRKKTTTIAPPVVGSTELTEAKRGQPEQLMLLSNHNDPKFQNAP